MIRHRIIRTTDDRKAEKHLDEMENSGWYKTSHFFVDGFHIMVFEMGVAPNPLDQVKTAEDEVFSKKNLDTFMEIFG